MTKTFATLSTSLGDIRVELFANHAPKTVRNFTELATGAREWTDPRSRAKTSTPLFNGTVFHRVISGFMIQGGDPLGTGTGGPGYSFADEFHPELAFDRAYLLAMANSGPATNGSQFFITASRAVVDAIEATATGRADRPVIDVVITKVTIETGE
jgi:peptidyl-prolyl cis-trans isomerase A (cyclophilin A)